MKDFLQTVLPSEKQKWLYILAPTLILGILAVRQEYFQFYFDKALPYLQQDKAVSILGLTTLWFLTSTYLLRFEKSAEIKLLKDKIESLEDSIRIVANTSIAKDKQIVTLTNQLNYKNVVDESNKKIQDKMNEPTKVKYM